jgi:hypothetical protein
MKPKNERKLTPAICGPALEKIPIRLELIRPEHGALVPNCQECGAVWLCADHERWRAYRTDDEPPELVFYCPQCAEREFGV